MFCSSLAPVELIKQWQSPAHQTSAADNAAEDTQSLFPLNLKVKLGGALHQMCMPDARSSFLFSPFLTALWLPFPHEVQ